MKAVYSQIANFFIDYFWEHPEINSEKQITAEIYNIAADSRFTVRMRQCAALAMVLGAKNTPKKNSIEREVEELLGEKIFNELVKPVHNGKKMTLSSQCVRVENGRNSFDLWLVMHSVGKGIKLYIPLKKHRQFLFLKENFSLAFFAEHAKHCYYVIVNVMLSSLY